MHSYDDLRPYQHRAIDRFYEYDAQQAVIPMGGGKTVCKLTAIKELLDAREIRRAVVLAPKRVAQLVWPSELREWDHLADLRMSVAIGNAAQRKAAFEADTQIVVSTIDNIQWMVDLLKGVDSSDPLFDFLSFDEISRVKNPRSKRLRALMKLAPRWNSRHGLTGTPRPNGYEDQFGPMKLLSNGRLWGKSFDQWRNRYFMATDFQGYNWSIRPEWRDKIRADIARYSFTISEEDMPELPELTTNIVWIDLPPAARNAYQRMKKDLVARIKDKTMAAANMAVASGKLEQIAQGFLYDQPFNTDEEGEPEGRATEELHHEKEKALADLVEGAGGEPILITYWYAEDLIRLKKALPNLPSIGSHTTDAEAVQYERAWNRRELPYLAIHPASAGHGLNLQKGGAQLIHYTPIWSAELFDQVRKRIWRPGQTRRVFEHLIMARDTVDELKHGRTVMKMSEQELFRKFLESV